jgi:isopenicillin-N N-acyltransferase like protein
MDTGVSNRDKRDIDVDYFPEVEVSGSPYQRGQMHGCAVPERVVRSARLYRHQLIRQGVAAHRLTKLALGMCPIIQRFDPAYLEEMQGIADGAGVALADIVLINCRTEMMFGQAELKMACKGLDDSCTNLVVLPGQSENGRLMHAHNWDWRQECIDTGIVLRVRRGGNAMAPDLLMFTEAGALARHGFNSAGVSLTANFLSSDRDYRQLADVPQVLVRRKMLEAQDINAAMKILWRTRRFCSHNLMLAQAGVNRDGAASGEAINLECAPDEIFWLTPQKGVLVHANHWLCPVARTKLRERGLAENPDSIYRQLRVEAAMHRECSQGAGKIGWSAVKQALAGDFLGAVLRTPGTDCDEVKNATVATTLIDAAGKTMWVARKPYQAGAFIEYKL